MELISRFKLALTPVPQVMYARAAMALFRIHEASRFEFERRRSLGLVGQPPPWITVATAARKSKVPGKAKKKPAIAVRGLL